MYVCVSEWVSERECVCVCVCVHHYLSIPCIFISVQVPRSIFLKVTNVWCINSLWMCIVTVSKGFAHTMFLTWNMFVCLLDAERVMKLQQLYLAWLQKSSANPPVSVSVSVCLCECVWVCVGSIVNVCVCLWRVVVSMNGCAKVWRHVGSWLREYKSLHVWSILKLTLTRINTHIHTHTPPPPTATTTKHTQINKTKTAWS